MATNSTAVPQTPVTTRIRRRFEERFSVTRMAKDYVRLYRKILAKHGREKEVDGARRQPEYRQGSLESAMHAD